MSRLDLHHLAWSKATPGRLGFDLADSGVATPDLAGLGLPHVTGLPPPADETPHRLERALGERLSAPGGRVLVTAGASEANAAALAGLLDPGDDVLAERPGYEPHRAVARLFGARVRTFTRPRALGFGGVAEAVEAELGPRTRLVVLTHLHNPSGAALGEADAEALDRLAERRDFRILCDETFRDAEAGPPIGTFASRSPRWVTTSSLTKVYGLSGLRIGWIAAAEGVLARCADAQNALSVIPATPSAALALALVPHLDTLRERAHRILRANHAGWAGWAARIAGAGWGGGALDTGVAPRGTTAWCLFRDEAGGDAFAEFTAAQFDLAVTPGRFFGDPRGVRIGLGSEPARFGRALVPLEQALESFLSRSAHARNMP
jgi:hypothetical protein